MTQQDLSTAGILQNNEKISSVETALLFLNYNELIAQNKEDFLKLKSDLLLKFNNLEGLDDKMQEKFFNCVIDILQVDLKDIINNNKLNSDKIIAIHNYCVNNASIYNYSKSHINQAKTLSEVCDTLKVRGKTYLSEKEQYNYIKQCANDEGVFTNFYSRVEGRVSQDQARCLVNNKLCEIEKDFLKKQDRYLKFLVNFQIMEDIILNYNQRESAV